MANIAFMSRIADVADFPFDDLKLAFMIVYQGEALANSNPNLTLRSKVFTFPGSGATAEIKVQIGGVWKDAGTIDVEGWV
jgi:hypothetical protein